MTSSKTYSASASSPNSRAPKRGRWPLKGGGETQRQHGQTEVIPPHLQAALDALELRQALEWRELERLEGIAKLMDAQFAIPLTPVRLGLDSLVGIIPVLGDTISFGVAGFIIVQARRMGANSAQILRMLFNSAVDWMIGLVPVLGDLLDVGWRSNLRNTDYLREILEAKWAKERADIFSD